MIATLKELCIQQTAAHIVEGRLKTASRKLDGESSNSVFAEFMKSNMHDNFSESCQNIKNLLTLTKVELYGVSMDENLCEMIHEQNIKELTLERFRYYDMFRLRRDDEDYEGRLYIKTHVDICAMLENLLNPESRRKLTKLEINGSEIRFSKGWVEKIANLLPSLQELNLLGMEADEKTIQSVYENFPNLTELDISGSQITNLDGISKMSKLTALSISGIDFNSTKDIEELFELKNLKTLFVQGDINRGSSHFMLLYMGSRKCLPQLEHLICSYNEMTEAMLQILLRYHKNLKYIDLTGTSLKNRSQITGRGLKLFTMGTFKDCLCTANMFVQYNASKDYLDPILAKLGALLHDQYDQISQKELSECLELMCQIINSYSNLCYPAADILEIMCRGTRAEEFSFVERQHLIFTIFNSFEKGCRRMIESRHVHTDPIWDLLSNQVILETSTGNLNKLCEYAASAFQVYLIHQGCPPTSIMAVLAKNLDNMSTDRAKALASNLEKNVLNAIRFFITKKTDVRRELQYLCTIIHKIYVIRSEKTMEIDKKCVEIFCKAISTFKNDIENQMKLVATLEHIIGLMHDGAMQVLLDNEEVFPGLMELFYDQYTLQQKEAINLFLSMYCKANNSELLEDKPLEEVQKLLVKDVNILLRGFKTSSGDMLDGLKWILEKSESEITKEMCKWMIEEFGRGEQIPFFYNFTRRFPY